MKGRDEHEALERIGTRDVGLASWFQISHLLIHHFPSLLLRLLIFYPWRLSADFRWPGDLSRVFPRLRQAQAPLTLQRMSGGKRINVLSFTSFPLSIFCIHVVLHCPFYFENLLINENFPSLCELIRVCDSQGNVQNSHFFFKSDTRSKSTAASWHDIDSLDKIFQK